MRNEPAFPMQDWDASIQAQRTHTGMTLRDYFAAKAMQGLLASEVEASMKEFAEKAYAMSDAMLKARGNK
jgi:hypothetical protein